MNELHPNLGCERADVLALKAALRQRWTIQAAYALNLDDPDTLQDVKEMLSY
jgi:hypothetical protein